MSFSIKMNILGFEIAEHHTLIYPNQQCFFFFLQGITLPVPPVLETLEHKMPSRVLKTPAVMDFLKVENEIHLALNAFHKLIISLFKKQKCLDKDPAKRWPCERLLNHPLFEEYIARRKEAAAEQSDDSNRLREKSKVSWIIHDVGICICYLDL